mmetsp:Transcript_36065/g.89651  ORF Transcript_36065/g.89651 Transcript_36065/m.89651 type:complete len:448 (+) Transcript_36065:130-1473(+)
MVADGGCCRPCLMSPWRLLLASSDVTMERSWPLLRSMPDSYGASGLERDSRFQQGVAGELVGEELGPDVGEDARDGGREDKGGKQGRRAQIVRVVDLGEAGHRVARDRTADDEDEDDGDEAHGHAPKRRLGVRARPHAHGDRHAGPGAEQVGEDEEGEDGEALGCEDDGRDVDDHGDGLRPAHSHARVRGEEGGEAALQRVGGGGDHAHDEDHEEHAQAEGELVDEEEGGGEGDVLGHEELVPVLRDRDHAQNADHAHDDDLQEVCAEDADGLLAVGPRRPDTLPVARVEHVGRADREDERHQRNSAAACNVGTARGDNLLSADGGVDVDGDAQSGDEQQDGDALHVVGHQGDGEAADGRVGERDERHAEDSGQRVHARDEMHRPADGGELGHQEDEHVEEREHAEHHRHRVAEALRVGSAPRPKARQQQRATTRAEPSRLRVARGE